eukprot:COSAG02_NODE_45582_length_355_cov_1223.449219_1_plen_74_part_10
MGHAFPYSTLPFLNNQSVPFGTTISPRFSLRILVRLIDSPFRTPIDYHFSRSYQNNQKTLHLHSETSEFSKEVI